MATFKTETTGGGVRSGVTLKAVEYKVASVEGSDPQARFQDALSLFNGDLNALVDAAVSDLNNSAKKSAVNASGVSEVNTAIAALKRMGKTPTEAMVSKYVEIKRRQAEELAALA